MSTGQNGRYRWIVSMGLIGGMGLAGVAALDAVRYLVFLLSLLFIG